MGQESRNIPGTGIGGQDGFAKDFTCGFKGLSPAARGLRTDDRQHPLSAADHPWLLQTYVWQDYDLCPNFPVLNKFLNFWLETLEGPLHSVTVVHARLIKPAEIRAVDGEFRLH